MTINYWSLVNKDPGMQKFAKERTQAIFKTFVQSIDRYTNGSYQRMKKLDDKTEDPLWTKSDQRIDFMSNLYREIIKHATSKLQELENERDRRI
jgi:hypothetical protein